MPYVYHHDLQLHYEVEGEGPPLVLHHGFSDSLTSWREYGYSEQLRTQYQLILIDARGHGASDKPYHVDAYGQLERAADVIAVLDALQIERTHYVGYSMGAWIGFGLARLAPARFHSMVLGGVHPYGQSMAFYREGLRHGIRSWVETLQRLAHPLPMSVDRLLANDVRALRAAVAHDRPDISDLLPEMTMPCLLFAGDADPLRAGVARCSHELPYAGFFSVQGGNHIQTILSSHLVLPNVLRFLAAQAMPARA